MSDLLPHTTHDHQEIRHWVEKRGGVPVRITNTVTGEVEPGIHFLDHTHDDEFLEQMSWEDFFEEFDQLNQAFLYQEEEVDGELSNFYKFVSREET